MVFILNFFKALSYCYIYLQGGNDHEIFNDERTIGHTVKNPEDLKKQVEELLKSFTDEC